MGTRKNRLSEAILTRQFLRVPTIFVLSKDNITIFHLKNYHFTAMGNISISYDCYRNASCIIFIINEGIASGIFSISETC